LLELLKSLKLVLPSSIGAINQWWWPRRCYDFLSLCI